ncbi:hypothetical protein VTL71DRAFT_7240 [Oculimacula yallundae]|uniref:GST C-terminal domain-containing protein n=1 Tax=Oculimacula yallundae TaxID=86028 RepID=A0ABR4BWY7_9HELO
MMEQNSTITFSVEEEPRFHLLGTYTRYSSWTARVVTVLEYFRIPYKATYVLLADVNQPPSLTEYILIKTQVKKRSKNGLVPILTPLTFTPSLEINDSLSICEFLAESYPELELWPRDQYLRALARSAVAEMHSGFGEIRNSYHTNFVAKYDGDVAVTGQARKEIERLLSLWDQARNATRERSEAVGDKDDGFLFGKFGIADAFFWPVLWRFRTYNLPLNTASPEALAWIKRMWSDPTLKRLGKDYFKQAQNPDTAILKYDDIFKDVPGIRYGLFEEDWGFEH